MPISADILRGHTDTIILAQLEAGDSYGWRINKTVAQRTGEKVTVEILVPAA